MASIPCYLPTIISLFILLIPFIVSSSLAEASPSDHVSPATICTSTPHPSYCRSILPDRTANVYDYGRFSIHKSLSQSRKFLDLVEQYRNKYRSSLSISAVRALEDCRFLAGLNEDFLLSSSRTVNATSETLSSKEADDVQTFLSAIITNQQTCLDSLESTDSARSIRNGLMGTLLNDTKLHSVSLAFFTMGWVPKNKTLTARQPSSSKHIGFKHRRLLMSSGTRSTIYETVSRRKLLQTNDSDEVLISKIVVVSLDGSGNFTTINAAISAAPNNTNGLSGYFLIYITAGVYQEYISIPNNKKYLMMIGDGINQTVITGNQSVADGWTTFNSATFAVVAPNFVAVNITFRNTAGAIKGQAVAVRNGADLSAFYSCSFEGYQDTLYTHSLRQFYRECDIYGTVDFIFGNAAVVLQNCNIYARQPLKGQYDPITAQGRTDPNQNTGTLIHICNIKAADDLVSSNYSVKTYLGRPWKEYSRTVYMQSFVDSLIDPAGWKEWSGNLSLSTLYYAEYDNNGPGSNTSKRVTWPGYHVINATYAANFTVSSFLLGNDWLPDTGVPYDETLI
ncbi:putative pectinesterase/pectinesterase inhibitor 41 [Hibiscus syriacus]|uniref:Pectinesterase n=1 Tax=Hibiscus syriacus TaxID=106335 RepID=A0A6A2ZNX1_HIBSY|nr:probable pectinesterase/pectinesterase inhibitor 20 [Hibiscus syriacus]KAE8693731.1 putative pectinesterase/pectinesterase inhibitor 41 [Hibiscus syriacus]